MEVTSLKAKCFVYLRVSRVEQDEETQFKGIKEYIDRYSLPAPILISERITGKTPWRERRLGELENQIAAGDYLLVSELSRIGRNTADVLQFLAWATSKQVIVIATKSQMRIDASIQSKIFTTIMALASEIERDFMSQRTREGLAVARAKGKKIGRPQGQSTKHALDPFSEEIRNALAHGASKAFLCRLYGCSRGKLDRALNLWEKHPDMFEKGKAAEPEITEPKQQEAQTEPKPKQKSTKKRPKKE